MTGGKKHTVRTLRKMKTNGEKIVMLTAYDAPTAKFAQAGGVDMILVGDSLGMAALGYSDTVPVTMDDMVHHCKAVRRGAPETFIVGDMPFLSFHLSEEQTLLNAARLIQDANCDAVKLETDRSTIPVVKRLVEAGIPVCAHIGLLPQSVKTSGGYRIHGRKEEEAEALLEDAIALQEAGAFAIVFECLPASLAKKITERLDIPTIGIGAGAYCDGQVQVIADLVGFFTEYLPKHAKRYADLGNEMKKAVSSYVEDVRRGAFPGADNATE